MCCTLGYYKLHLYTVCIDDALSRAYTLEVHSAARGTSHTRPRLVKHACPCHVLLILVYTVAPTVVSCEDDRLHLVRVLPNVLLDILVSNQITVHGRIFGGRHTVKRRQLGACLLDYKHTLSLTIPFVPQRCPRARAARCVPIEHTTS